MPSRLINDFLLQKVNIISLSYIVSRPDEEAVVAADVVDMGLPGPEHESEKESRNLESDDDDLETCCMTVVVPSSTA